MIYVAAIYCVVGLAFYGAAIWQGHRDGDPSLDHDLMGWTFAGIVTVIGWPIVAVACAVVAWKGTKL